MALSALGVGLRRPDLLVIATPLIIAATAGTMSRPSSIPSIRQWLGHDTVREGDATTLHISVEDTDDRITTIAAVLSPQRFIELRPQEGQTMIAVAGERVIGSMEIVVRPIRWGTYNVGRALVVATSGWGAFRWIAPGDGPANRLLVVPRPSGHDERADAPAATPGLVGSHRSPRYGSGTEFATIRPFSQGDRMHRIRWPPSLRTGTLQVATTWADQDRHVILIADAVADVGRSTGIDGIASSLDITTRATAALAEHHLAQGDRVSLVVVGSQRRHRLAPATGAQHLRRVLATLATIEPAGVLIGPDRIPKRIGRGSLVIILSPLRSPWALTRAVAMSDQGLLVVVVDCLPPDIEQQYPHDVHTSAAWRIEKLRREHHFLRAGQRGVAVVPWNGPARLDAIVRDLHGRRHLRSGRPS